MNWYWADSYDTAWNNYDLGSFDSGAAADLGLWAVSETSVTPEPASLALVATGLLGVAGVVRRRKA